MMQRSRWSARFTPGLVLALLLATGCDPQNRPLTQDPQVTMGRLDNGLTYYVRHNEKPKARLDLRLVVKAGSILEDDDQQGLAHYLEHMAFNGTEHFDRQQLVDYLESIGMRFGPELNAYTSFDETVYLLQVPTTDGAMVENGLRILRDWAFGIRNADEEFKKERGVIVEEWRLGRGASQRIRDRQLPVLFAGSRYALRLPIGQKEVLDKASVQRVRDFYHDWYRPELMAVIAVGDIEPAALAEKLRTCFAGARPPAQPRERAVYPVPDHAETLVSVATDKEATQSAVSLAFKLPPFTVATVGDYRRNLVESLSLGMLNERLDELRRGANPPFLGAGASKRRLGLSKDSFFLSAQVKEGGFLTGLEALFAEARRAAQHGFTATELERAKRNAMANIEKAFSERDTTDSGAYVSECLEHFLHGDVSPGLAAELELHRRLLPGIELAEANQALAECITASNRVILASGPEKTEAKTPAAEELLDVLKRVSQADLPAYTDDVGSGSLLETAPVPGAVASRSAISNLGVTVWKLSNGITVMLKPTTFKKDEIVFTGFRPGGNSVVRDEDFIPASSAEAILGECGWGRYSDVQLRKKLAGRIAGSQPYIAEFREGINGSARPEDLETALQLVYLNFTAPRPDAQAFAAYKERTRDHLIHRLARPDEVYADEIQRTFYAGHLRRRPWTVETLDQLDLTRSVAIHRQRFQSAAGFVFFFAGNLDVEKTERLVDMYLGSLPATGPAGTWKDQGVRPVTGQVSRVVEKGQDPKSRVTLLFSGDMEWTLPERHRLKSLQMLLQIRLREKIREELGGTYGVGVGVSAERYPVPAYQVRIGFGCSPDQVDSLIQAVRAEIESVKSQLVDEIYLTKVKQTCLREREVALERNEFWTGALESASWNGDDPSELILDFPKRVEALTREDLQNAARRYLGTLNVATFVLKPERAAP